MTRLGKSLGKPATALLVGCAAILLAVMLWAPDAHAYPMYDDGAGNGCVQCHNGFLGGNGPLHLQHRNNFAVTTCNLCHPSGGGTTPVLTYYSGPGGGYGCAGCHGQDYGEISPDSHQPKATSYGLRLVHVANGVTQCGTSGCHHPGALGAPDPYPTPYGEHVPPPYYHPAYSNLTDPCSSAQEDLPFDSNTIGLDNDGNGVADWPADPDCPQPLATPTPTPTPIVPNACASTPVSGCIAAAKAVVLVNEKNAGKEKVKATLKGLAAVVAPSQFGNPVSGSTAYSFCIYDAANHLSGSYIVAQAGATCAGAPCWATVSDKGYKYQDTSTATDGISKINLHGGDSGKGKISFMGSNGTGSLPTGVAAVLQNQTSATIQLVTSGASCFGVTVTQVKKADGSMFKAKTP
jgi:hypothetical protein